MCEGLDVGAECCQALGCSSHERYLAFRVLNIAKAAMSGFVTLS